MTPRYWLAAVALLAGCSRLDDVGRVPAMSPVETGDEYYAMTAAQLPDRLAAARTTGGASLWSGMRGSLLGDRRAGVRGDIVTVVIEIDDRAEISNSSGRSRTGSEKMGIPGLFGIPQRIDQN